MAAFAAGLISLSLSSWVIADDAGKGAQAKPSEPKTEAAKAREQNSPATAVSEDAKKKYAKTCASCHGKDAKGNPAMAKMFKADPSALDLVDEKTLGMTDAELIKIIAEGLNKMPAYKGKISDSLIAEIVVYIRSLK